MQLVIDIGNTRVKLALFNQNNLLQAFVLKNTEALFDENILEKYPIENCIVCTVVDHIEPFLEQLKYQVNVILYTTNTPIPLKNCYQTPDTLGADRLAVSVAGNFVYPNQNVLVIDAGTCIKYNFISAKNEFIGGGISPGLEMRFKAIHAFTSRLPLLEVNNNYNRLIGCNSEDNIMSGVALGAVAEINSFIEQYQEKYPEIKVLLTGGDVNFFEKRLKKPIFADSYLTLKGLNSILTHNLQLARL